MQTFDITIIGSGPGGYVAAVRAAQNGTKVAIVERKTLGGVCLNWGCIPTKTLIASTDVLETVNRAGEFGVHLDGEASVDWKTMMARKGKVVSTLNKGIGSLMKANGVTVFSGNARFLDRKRITVTDSEGEETVVDTKKVIIATGGQPVVPGFLPDSERVLTSRDALSLDALPNSMLILGGGVIGCEWACMFARLGVQVTVVEMLPSLLPEQDHEVIRLLEQSMRKLGVTVLTDSRMESVQDTGKSVKTKVGEELLEADCLLVSVGRKPLTDGLDLEAAGLKTDEGGAIPVDARCATDVPGIYAIGDVTGGIHLAHRASAMGVCAADNASGHRAEHNDRLVPSCIFTAPEIGAVGLTENVAKEQGEVRVGKFPFQALGKALAIGEKSGFCKIVADAETDQVLGVHVVGPHATDLISEAASAMSMEVTAEELGRVIHPHPTLGEALMETAHAVHDRCIHLPPPRKR